MESALLFWNLFVIFTSIMEDSFTPGLDRIDLKILRELQADGTADKCRARAPRECQRRHLPQADAAAV